MKPAGGSGAAGLRRLRRAAAGRTGGGSRLGAAGGHLEGCNDLAGGVVVVWRAEDQLGAQRNMQSRSEGTSETRVAVGDDHFWQTHAAEHGPDVVAGRSLGSSSLKGRDQPDAAGQEVDVHLQEVMPGTGHGQLEKVQAAVKSSSTESGSA